MPELKLENYFNTYFLIYINFFSKETTRPVNPFVILNVQQFSILFLVFITCVTVFADGTYAAYKTYFGSSWSMSLPLQLILQ